MGEFRSGIHTRSIVWWKKNIAKVSASNASSRVFLAFLVNSDWTSLMVPSAIQFRAGSVVGLSDTRD